MQYRSVGNTTVSAVGLGAMPLFIEHLSDEQRAIATVHAVLDAGVTLIVTADSYHWHASEAGHNELLIARALARYGADTSGVLVATKGGRGRPGDGSWTVRGNPGHLKRAAEASAKRLGVEAISLYKLHKPDPAVPWADSVGALRELLDAGTIRAAGISNMTTVQIRQAYAILGDGLVSVQNQYSPAVRDSEPKLQLSTEPGLAFLPWSPLGAVAGRAPFHRRRALPAQDRPGLADAATSGSYLAIPTLRQTTCPRRPASPSRKCTRAPERCTEIVYK